MIESFSFSQYNSTHQAKSIQDDSKTIYKRELDFRYDSLIAIQNSKPDKHLFK